MGDSINMSKSLLRMGGRKAPALTVEEFASKILGYLSRSNISPLSKEDVNKQGLDILRELRYCNLPVSKEIPYCTMGYFVNSQGCPLVGLQRTSTGFCYYGVCGFDNVTNYGYKGLVFYILYWDGKQVRAYVPHYGNLFIPKFGFENMENEWETSRSDYMKFEKSKRLRELSSVEREEVNKAYDYQMGCSNLGLLPLTGNLDISYIYELPYSLLYRIENGYNFKDYMVGHMSDFNWEAIELDIESRIEIYY